MMLYGFSFWICGQQQPGTASILEIVLTNLLSWFIIDLLVLGQILFLWEYHPIIQTRGHSYVIYSHEAMSQVDLFLYVHLAADTGLAL